MTIRQLDLVMIGSRAITSRLGEVEGSVRRFSTFGYGDSEQSLSASARPNLLINSSFESYQRNSTVADGWLFTNAAVATEAQADGLTVVSLSPNGVLQQSVQGSTVYPAGAFAFSVSARSGTAQLIGLSVTHTSAEVGTLYRIAPDGSVEETNTLPGDSQWYRFVLSGLLLASGTVTVQITTPSGNTAAIQVDAAKYEYVQGADSSITPTAYQPEDAGLASMVRNFRADNIVAGTLTVGGSLSSNPRISVLDGSNAEIVSIGAPVGGYYGINVSGEAGIRVSGSGSVELDGGGSVWVKNGGSVIVNGTGAIRAGVFNGQRVQLTADGLAAFNSSNQEQVRLDAATGRLRVLGSGAVSVEGGGSFIAGTPGGARMEYTAGGLFAYNASNQEKVSISVSDATVRVASDALIVTGELVLEDLRVDGELSVGQDLRVGTNVLFVNQSGGRVGINRVPDAQFDLDIAGNIRWGGWGVGKMAIQLEGATAIMHFDGSLKNQSDYSGFLDTHLGQRPVLGVAAATFLPGKFGKALFSNEAVTNLLVDPSFESGTDGWTSSWGDSTSTSTDQALFGTRSLTVTADGTTQGAGTRKDITGLTPGQPYTLSAYFLAPVGRRMRIRVWDGASWDTQIAVSEYCRADAQWSRVSTTFTPSGTVARCVFIDDEAGVSTGVYYIDGAQLETGLVASPFIASGTRARNTLGYTATGWALPEKGAVMAWARADGVTDATAAFLIQHFFGGGNRIYIYFHGGLLRWALGGTFHTSSVTIPTGWAHYALTWEGTTGSLYVNGALVQTASFSGLSEIKGALRVGNDGQVNNSWRGLIDEVVVLDRTITAAEVRAVYESNAPVFAETSNWNFRTANTLAWADEEGLWAVSETGAAAFGVSGVGGKSWGGLTLDAGDVLLGGSTSYVWWDASANTVKMTGDFTAGTIVGSNIRTGTSGARIELNPSAGLVVLGSDSAYRVNIPITGGIDIYSSADPSEAARGVNFRSGGRRRGIVSAYVDGSSVSHVGLIPLNGSGNSVGTSVSARSDQTVRVFTNFQEMLRVNTWPNGVWVNGPLEVGGASGQVVLSGTGGYFNANSATGGYRVNGTQVVGPRDTGWGSASGTTSKASFDTGSITLAALAQRVGALWNMALSHGLIGS